MDITCKMLLCTTIAEKNKMEPKIVFYKPTWLINDILKPNATIASMTVCHGKPFKNQWATLPLSGNILTTMKHIDLIKSEGGMIKWIRTILCRFYQRINIQTAMYCVSSIWILWISMKVDNVSLNGIIQNLKIMFVLKLDLRLKFSLIFTCSFSHSNLIWLACVFQSRDIVHCLEMKAWMLKN